VKPEVVFIERRTLCDGFQTVEKIEFRIAASSRKNQTAALVGLRFLRLQAFHEL
jgi:hypothetical protein